MFSVVTLYNVENSSSSLGVYLVENINACVCIEVVQSLTVVL